MNVILGAGLSGLSAALHLEDNYEIYEANNRIGGTASSETHSGFVFDYGIHVLHTKNPYVLTLLSKIMGDNLKVQKRKAWIMSKGVYTKYPFQANTYGLPIDTVKECLIEFIKVKYSRQKKKPANYREWIEQTFGEGIAKHFMVPYSEKMWCTDPKNLSLDWVNPRFPQPTIEEVIDGALHMQEKEFGVNADFRYPIHGGIQAISEALASKTKKPRLSKKAEKIFLKEKKIQFEDNEKVSYDKLVSTVPLPELINMIDVVPEKVKNAAEDLQYVSDTVVNFGLDKKISYDYHWVYFPEKEFPFLRVNFPQNLSPYVVPKGKSSIQAEVFHASNKMINKKDLLNKVTKGLNKVGLLKESDPISFSNIIDIKYSYVLYTHNMTRNLAVIHKFLEKNSICPCGRFGEWQYFWMDDAILSGKKVAETIMGSLCTHR